MNEHIPAPVRVLVVEDDERALAAHVDYVRRISGFEVIGTAMTGAEAARIIRQQYATDPVQLVLLDLDLPDIPGLELCRKLRSGGVEVDVMVVTAARDLAAVRAAVSLGAVQYVVKPFTFATFADKMRAFAAFRRPFETGGEVVSQAEIDQTFAALRGATPVGLAKGLTTQTLQRVADGLRAAGCAMSATEIGESCDLSRVTARRYLEHLHDVGQVVRAARYGTPGRPEQEYRWRSPG